jgi:hypothetical protein
MKRIFAAAAIALSPVAAPAAEPVGDAIYHYVRSNSDGSEPEHIVHFRPNRTEVAVYKWVSKCSTAAYVTAEMNQGVTQARRYVAGKVARDGSQARFGTLTLDEPAAALVLNVELAAESIAERFKLAGRPFILYDFDLADLNAVLQHNGGGKGFRFELPLIWPDEGPSLFRAQGRLTARLSGREQHLGRETLRFDLAVGEPTPATGRLWLDAKDHFIVEAELGLPNHPGYKDFRLRLDRVETGGQKAWDALTQGHYAGCPTGN